MNCSIAQECMMRYFDGNLNDIETAQFRQHLKTCQKCKEDFESMKEIFDNLGEDFAAEPPDDFEIQVMEKIAIVEANRKKKSARFIAFLYSFAALMLLAPTVFLVKDLQGMGTSGNTLDVNKSINSFSDMLSATWESAETVFSVLGSVIGAFLHIMFVVIKNYFYVFIALAAVLFAVEWMFVSLVRRNNGGMIR
ncbi:MAG TPA: zf-HC2 domain-containing protein [Clostridia bacterium]|nr:zf-HC2 domain-containing protein [Clostridia bacterium]